MNLFAYTYSFGNGFSATLSLEDGTQRSVNNDLAFPLFAPVFAPIASTYAGELMPDVVANLRYTGTWGGAQLSAALHQIRDVSAGVTTVGGVTGPVLNPITGLPNPTFADTDYGFAVAALGYANVPALGVGDTVWMMATYTDGAIGYLNGGQSDAISDGFIGAGALSMPITDAFVDPFTGEFKANKAYAIAGGLNHNWTPTIQTNVFGSWMRFDAPGVAQYVVPTTVATIAAGTAGTTTGLVDFDETRVGANVIWTPVKEFLIGVEALYIRVDPRERVAVPITTAAGDPTGAFRSSGSEDTWEGRLRVQRDFSEDSVENLR